MLGKDTDVRYWITLCLRQKKQLIEQILGWFEEIREGLVGVKIPYGTILKINSFKEELEKKLKESKL